MRLKDFFKPTIGKIIAFVVFIALSIIYIIFIDRPVSCLIDQGASFCYGTPSVITKFLTWPVNVTFGFLFNLGILTANNELMLYINLLFRISVLFLGIVGNLLYLYIISTLILKVIEKFKNRIRSSA